ncbi:hypothetical protein LMH87_009427 [Akanthomyces muscarius]|uniref:C2H2-type domain-containing protein n=1 Tax=Akanthomyces muscarius TaxID=2231603 RepID=A0A9W8QDZ0_AKAMU|nr:hypothetical protein LMH87_009427 [Akanthomyces muscarius]KAJ4152909.1 hypothetical protein LMH87_009427 [Akanthomyces muscarius]
MITNGALGDGTIDPLVLRLEPQEYSISASDMNPMPQAGLHAHSLQQDLEHQDDQGAEAATSYHHSDSGSYVQGYDLQPVDVWAQQGTCSDLISGSLPNYTDAFLAALEHDGAKGWKFPEYYMPWDGQLHRAPNGLYYCPEYACANRPGDEFSRDLRRHAKGHFRPIACPVCCYRSIEQKEMKRHFHEVHAQNLPQHVCPHPGCGLNYKRLSSVRRHVHERHPGLGYNV